MAYLFCSEKDERRYRCSVNKKRGGERTKGLRVGKGTFIRREQRVRLCTGLGLLGVEAAQAEACATSLTDLGEVEVGDELIGFGRIDLDGDVLLGESGGGEIEQDGCTDEEAARFRTGKVGATFGIGRFEKVIAVVNGDGEIAPEIGRTRNERWRIVAS